MKKLVLIDSNALVHRAFHALPPLTSPQGVQVNAVYGFLSVLIKMIGDVQPDYIAATFDLAGPTFRHEEYEEYKATRVKAPDELYAQIPVVKDMLASFGIPVYEQKGYEADDIIGSLAELSKNIPDLQTIIVTGDMDTLQLVQDTRVVVFTLRKGMADTVIYDEDGVRERYGLAPEQVVDFKGLKGDPSDNIPGVPGIGEKTATALIQEFGSLDALYTAIEKGKTKKPLTEKLIAKLVEHKDMALFSRKLATIIRTVDVQFELEQTAWRTHADREALETKCKDLGFFSLVKRLGTVFGTAAAAEPEQKLDLDGDRTESVTPTTGELPPGDTVAIHALIESGSITTCFATTDGSSVVRLDAPTPEALAGTLRRYRTVIGHDIKPILKCLPALEGPTYYDTRIGAWLCNPEMRDYSLERAYYELTSQTLAQEQSQWPLAIWKLRTLTEERMKSFGVERVFSDIEMPLLPVLVDMERRGILVNPDRIAELLEATSAQLIDLEKKIYKLAGTEFNINSPAQLSDILFTRLALRGRVRRTGGGAPSTAAAELEKLRHEHPIVDFILEYRELNKMKSTYIQPFPSLIAADGRIHTTYNQTGTATGRLSSSDPNLQNIPTRTELGQRFRAAFIAAPGHKLLSLDYSQLELRIVAHIADDATMIEAFKNGEDIHTRTASEIFGIAPVQVTKDMRRQAKVLNFGILYGMGVLGFARAAGVNRDTAKKFIDEYFARFSGVARYMERTKEEAFRDGYVSTLLGRRRPLPDIRSTIPQLAAQAERMAINHPVQGTAADIVKLTMIQIARQLGGSPGVRMLLQVHDELVLEVRDDIVNDIASRVRIIMEQTYPLAVPLTVDAKVGDNWAEMENIS